MDSNIPADRVKATKSQAREFRVALSTEAQRIVKKITYRGEKLLFARYTGRPITDAALEKRLTTLEEPGRPHGLRTSFRTSAQDTDGAPWDVAETVLGHSIGNKVERTYARSDLLEKRKVVMETWARFVTGQHAAKVIPIRLPPDAAGETIQRNWTDCLAAAPTPYRNPIAFL